MIQNQHFVSMTILQSIVTDLQYHLDNAVPCDQHQRLAIYIRIIIDIIQQERYADTLTYLKRIWNEFRLVWTWIIMGRIYVILNQPMQSISCYMIFLEQRPLAQKFWLELSVICFQYNMISETLKFASVVLDRMNPHNTDAHRICGTAYIRSGQAQKALDHFNQMLLLSPIPSSFILNNMGIAYKMLDEYQQSHIFFELALEQSYQNPDPYLNLTVLFMRIGQFKLALRVVRDGIGVNPTNGPTWAILANIYRFFNRSYDAAYCTNIFEELQRPESSWSPEFVQFIAKKRRMPSFLRKGYVHMDRLYTLETQLGKFTVQTQSADFEPYIIRHSVELKQSTV